MYLERVKAKGKQYLYLKEYDATIEFAANKKKTLYRFGRIDVAIHNIRSWYNDMDKLPDELRQIDCTRKDLASWIKYIENIEARSLSAHSTRHKDYIITT